MTMSHNVQLSSAERTVVHTDPDTKRILGFSPEGAALAVPPGTRYVSQTLYTARAIEGWAHRYREQYLRDEEVSTVKRLEAERPMRKAIRDAVLDRNNHCSARDRDLNNSLLKVMDHYYERAMSKRLNAEVCVTAEKYEANKLSTEIAQDSPHA